MNLLDQSRADGRHINRTNSASQLAELRPKNAQRPSRTARRLRLSKHAHWHTTDRFLRSAQISQRPAKRVELRSTSTSLPLAIAEWNPRTRHSRDQVGHQPAGSAHPAAPLQAPPPPAAHWPGWRRSTPHSASVPPGSRPIESGRRLIENRLGCHSLGSRILFRLF
jgi:hypothetical protein